MKFKEIETKYNADDIDLLTFTAFCKERGVHHFVLASGYDRFYAKKDTPGCFARHRLGADFNQLTFKRKTTDKNNFIRDEDNINLAKNTTVEQVESLCQKFGYSYNTTIFKNCFIYVYETFTLVYYIIYTEDMSELGRYMEIEMAEDHDWGTEENAWNALLAIERDCKPLGIVPQGRVKRSLFEIVCE